MAIDSEKNIRRSVTYTKENYAFLCKYTKENNTTITKIINKLIEGIKENYEKS